VNVEDLVNQLRRQLNFIVTSCRAYDAGIRAEAVRIAVAARVLFHDTRNSRSLVRGHLQHHDLKLRSTAVKLWPEGHFPGFIGLEPETGGFRPYRDDGPRDEQIEVDKWWENEPVLKIPTTNELITRKRLVLAAANTDGGAHVDINKSDDYKRLEEGLKIKLEVGYRDGRRGFISLEYANFAALRQIGHEILTSTQLTALAQ